MLTSSQKEFYDEICSIDSTWNEENFAAACNSIIILGNLFKVESGSVSINFDNSNFALLKLEKNNQTVVERKIYFNDWIKSDKSSVRLIAQNIQSLAEQLLTASSVK